MKKCFRCENLKSLDSFHKDRKSKDGRNRECKECRKHWLFENRERINSTKRERYANDPEYRERSRKACRKNHKKSQLNPENQFKRTKHFAGQRGYDFTLTMEEYAQIRAKPCYYCGRIIEQLNGGLDRLDNSLGYHIRNVVSCCKHCNWFRGADIGPHELLFLVDQLALMRGVPKNKVWDSAPILPNCFPWGDPYASETA